MKYRRCPICIIITFYNRNNYINIFVLKVAALHQVSLQIGEGECLGVVGESGSGKSTLGRLLLALDKPDRGDIRFQGVSLAGLQGKAMRRMRKHIQVVFQDPTASLNPRLPVWRSIMEPLDNFPEVIPPFLADVRHSGPETAAKLLEMVGQPGCICTSPKILKLLKSLQTRLGMSILFISHDLTAVRMISNTKSGMNTRSCSFALRVSRKNRRRRRQMKNGVFVSSSGRRCRIGWPQLEEYELSRL
ncbi:ATP-binding cassette domain-containing protein [Paenibacillus sp. JMULE4]|nr:ATP-binding cassette domain-containing protein [Paenibacillus sp. JMULE4]